MDIRMLVAGDYDKVRALFLRLHEMHVLARGDIYADVDPFTREDFEELLAAEDGFALVADEDGDVIGFCSATMRAPSKDARMLPRSVAHMDDIIVDERHRRCGVGRALFEAAKRESKARSAQSMELMVWSFNVNAMDFYKKCGMTTRSEILEAKL